MQTPVYRTGHPYYMYDELHAQPQAMDAVLQDGADQREHIAKELAGTHSAADVIVGPGFLAPALPGRGRVWLAGCGTAYHAALTGAEWLRRLTHEVVDVVALPSFEFTHYEVTPRAHDAMLALSHTGTASATVAAAAAAKRAGIFTVAITGTPGSPIAQTADEAIVTTATAAVAATFTISHTTMLMVLADIALRTAEHLHAGREPVHEFAGEVQRLPQLVRETLERDDAIKAVVATLPELRQAICIGGGTNWHAALEGALKLREAAYLPATGMEVEEILHGPFASIDEHALIVAIAPRNAANGDAARNRALDVLRAVRNIGATTIAFGSEGDDELAAAANHMITLPSCADLFSVVPATVALQMLTYWLAMLRGGNPDRIRRDQAQWQAARDQYVR